MVVERLLGAVGEKGSTSDTGVGIVDDDSTIGLGTSENNLIGALTITV